MDMVLKFLKSLRRAEWTIAIRKRGESLLFEEGGLNTPFTLIRNSYRFWKADPFLITYKGVHYLFFEYYDRFQRKGVLAFQKIEEDGSLSKEHICYELRTHLSYPYVFVENEQLYCIPESYQENKLLLLKFNETTEKFELDCVLIDNVAMVDTSIIEYAEERYLSTTPKLENDYKSQMNIYSWRKDCLPQLLYKNPLINDPSIARNGGKPFLYKKKLYRISQDCSIYYGGGINILEIDLLDRAEYKEHLICKIKADEVKVNGSIFDGIHTYNFDQNYEVIDCKRNSVFNFVEVLGMMTQFLKEMCNILRM